MLRHVQKHIQGLVLSSSCYLTYMCVCVYIPVCVYKYLPFFFNLYNVLFLKQMQSDKLTDADFTCSPISIQQFSGGFQQLKPVENKKNKHFEYQFETPCIQRMQLKWNCLHILNDIDQLISFGFPNKFRLSYRFTCGM